MSLIQYLLMSLPSLSLFLQLQLWRIKEALAPKPNHSTGPRKPSMSEQENE